MPNLPKVKSTKEPTKKNVFIDAKIHADLKRHCKEHGFKIEFVVSNILKDGLKTQKEKNENIQ